MASVSVGGSGTYVSAPVLGDRTLPGDAPLPVGGIVFADQNGTPQAYVGAGVDSVGGGFAAAALHTEQGNQGLQVRADDGRGHSQNVFLSPNNSPVVVGASATDPQVGVVLPNGTYVVAAAHTNDGTVQVISNAGGQDTNEVLSLGNTVIPPSDPANPQAAVVLPDGSYLVVAAHPSDGTVQVITHSGNQDNNTVIRPSDVVFTSTDRDVPQAGVILPNGTFVAGAVHTGDGTVQVRSNAGGEDTNVVYTPTNPVFLSPDPQVLQVGVVAPTGNYAVVAVNQDAGVAQVFVGDSSGQSFNQNIPLGIPEGLPGGIPTLPGAGAATSFLPGTGADTVVAPGAVATAINPEMGSTSLVGAGALSHVDTFFGGAGGGLVNLGADSVASSQLAGAFVQDQALNQLVAPAITDSHVATPSTGSVLSLDDGLTTIQLQGIGHKSGL